MEYIKTGNSKISGKTAVKHVISKELEGIGSGRIVWFLVTRHKYGLVSTWAVVITVLYCMPFIPDLLLSFVGK